MLYEIPSELTLDGYSTPINTSLSFLDKEYIKKWYPFPHSSAGQLRTGDDCDEIDFDIKYNIVEPDRVSFVLNSGSNVTWWKSIKIPVGSSEYLEIEVVNGSSSERSIRKLDLDASRPIRFCKAKFLGAHTELGYKWDAIPVLSGGTRITFTWTKDSCK